LLSHSWAAKSSRAESEILRRLASRSNSAFKSGETRQLYTSVFMHYIVAQTGGLAAFDQLPEQLLDLMFGRL